MCTTILNPEKMKLRKKFKKKIGGAKRTDTKRPQLPKRHPQKLKHQKTAKSVAAKVKVKTGWVGNFQVRIGRRDC